jgi:hypothetical protein
VSKKKIIFSKKSRKTTKNGQNQLKPVNITKLDQFDSNCHCLPFKWRSLNGLFTNLWQRSIFAHNQGTGIQMQEMQEISY